jgi:hypothetical protein
VKPLTTAQRSALHLAARKGGCKLADGKIRVQTANLLALKEWVTIVNGVVLITKAGRAKLNEPLPHVPVYMARGGAVKYKLLKPRGPKDLGRWAVDDEGDELTDHGYTTSKYQGVPGEDETMDLPRRGWAEHSAKLHEATRADADAMRLSGLTHPDERLAELRRIAAERGIDVSDEERFLQRARKAFERKVRGQAA